MGITTSRVLAERAPAGDRTDGKAAFCEAAGPGRKITAVSALNLSSKRGVLSVITLDYNSGTILNSRLSSDKSKKVAECQSD
jgi:hypothetical protein